MHVRVLQSAMEMISPHVSSQKRQETHVSIVDTPNARHMYVIDEDIEDDSTRAEL